MSQAAVTDIQAQAHAVKRSKNVIVLVWKGIPVMQGVDALRTSFAEAKQQLTRESLALVTVFEAAAIKKTPEAAVREGVAKVLADFEDVIGGGVIVFEGGGIKATVIRTLITAINLREKVNFPHRVVGSVGDGCNWLSDALGEELRLSPDELLGFVNRVRGSH